MWSGAVTIQCDMDTNQSLQLLPPHKRGGLELLARSTIVAAAPQSKMECDEAIYTRGAVAINTSISPFVQSDNAAYPSPAQPSATNGYDSVLVEEVLRIPSNTINDIELIQGRCRLRERGRAIRAAFEVRNTKSSDMYHDARFSVSFACTSLRVMMSSNSILSTEICMLCRQGLIVASEANLSMGRLPTPCTASACKHYTEGFGLVSSHWNPVGVLCLSYSFKDACRSLLRHRTSLSSR